MKNRPSSFIGRNRELKQLRLGNWRSKAQLVCMYGRRRVGKTALIEEAYRQGFSMFKFEGIEGVSQKRQLHHFLQTLKDYFPAAGKAAVDSINNWEEALRLLARQLKSKSINAQKSAQKKVVFFDEFQWMASDRSELVSLFKKVWDQEFSRLPECRFVLCGSVSSFMVRKVIRSKALYGRVDTEIRLEPFTLEEMSQFFKGRRDALEVLETALTLGGIPQYLLELNPDLSLHLNLNELAFSPNGFLFHEFQRLFVSHFGKNPIYEKIISTLALQSLSADELATKLKTKTGGHFTSLLEDLEMAGFIERVVPLQKQSVRSKIARFRIHDEYLHFYFRFIAPKKREIQNGNVQFGSFRVQKTFEQWRGYAFERLCRKNSRMIAETLGFAGIEYVAGSWFQAKNAVSAGTQVDLLFERSDRVLTLCEMKVKAPQNPVALAKELKARAEHVLSSYSKKMTVQQILIVLEPLTQKQLVKLKSCFEQVFTASDLFHLK